MKKLFLLTIFGLFLSCSRVTDQKKNLSKVEGDITTNKEIRFDKSRLKKMKESGFVISCGSGCAMRYSVKEIEGNRSKVKVQFSVQQFEDERETDNYVEDFLFYYNNQNKLLKIIRDSETESFLATQMPNSQIEFKKFGTRLIKEMNHHLAKDK